MNIAARNPEPAKPGDDLTEKQLELFIFACKFYVGNDMLPTYKSASEGLGYGYARGSYSAYQGLESKGYVERNKAGRPMFTEKGWQAAKDLIGLHPPTIIPPSATH